VINGRGRNQVSHMYYHPVHGTATSKREIFKYHEQKDADARSGRPQLSFAEWRQLPSSRMLGRKAQEEITALISRVFGSNTSLTFEQY